MSAALTIDSLTAILGREVDEIHLTVAKSSVLGLDPETIANTLGIPKAELEELMETDDYKNVRLLVGAEQAKDRVERDFSYDGLESIALKKLMRRAELENDTDTLLRIVAVANRATRRTQPDKSAVLDPSAAGARVPLTLTRRFTEKLSNTGQTIERTEVQQISVLDGSAKNPSFQEVQKLLQGTAEGASVDLSARMPKTNLAQIEAAQQDEDFDMESMLAAAKGIKNG